MGNNRGRGTRKLLILKRSAAFEKWWKSTQTIERDTTILGYIQWSKEKKKWLEISRETYFATRYQKKVQGNWIEISREEFHQNGFDQVSNEDALFGMFFFFKEIKDDYRRIGCWSDREK